MENIDINLLFEQSYDVETFKKKYNYFIKHKNICKNTRFVEDLLYEMQKIAIARNINLNN